jgi:thiol-disulfide isomerase/thioredoxin
MAPTRPPRGAARVAASRTNPDSSDLAAASRASAASGTGFTALDITGKRVKLSDFRGKVVLLNFWASWCGVCKTEKPSLSGMAGELGSNDFVVVTLASDKSWGNALGAVMDSLPAPPAARRERRCRWTLRGLREAHRGIPFKVFLDPPQGDDSIGPSRRLGRLRRLAR